jgi:ATP-dependent Clp protease adaptor protein ClpS
MTTSAPVRTPDVETQDKTRLIPRWKVILHNDDVTTFEFVIALLIGIFQKKYDEAARLTQEVHDSGSAVVAITSQERAELYVEQVRSLARPRGFPLATSIEPE